MGPAAGQATTLDDLDPIDVFWPTYEGVFAVTPSSTIGRVSWPPAAIGSLGQVLIEVEYDDDGEGDQTQERSGSVGRESFSEFSARRAPSLPRLQVHLPLLSPKQSFLCVVLLAKTSCCVCSVGMGRRDKSSGARIHRVAAGMNLLVCVGERSHRADGALGSDAQHVNPLFPRVL